MTPPFPPSTTTIICVELHHQQETGCLSLSLEVLESEIFQSEAVAAFHSAVNDGARFFNMPYFPMEGFPRTAPMGAGCKPIVSPRFQGK